MNIEELIYESVKKAVREVMSEQTPQVIENTGPAAMTVKEAAAYARVSLQTMYEFTYRADFYPLLRVGRKKLILKQAFTQWLSEQAG